MPKTSSSLPALTSDPCVLSCAYAPRLLTAGDDRNPETPTRRRRHPLQQMHYCSYRSKNAEEIIIFSFEEDGYAHLFAYIPGMNCRSHVSPSGDWDDISPAPSPDGESIAFASNRNGFWDLYLLDLSTGDITQLTDTPEYEGSPTWSPDGSFIAFESYINENLEIVIGSAEDPLDNPIRLTTSPASDHSPAWAPGGRQIAFISDGEVIACRSGSDQKQIAFRI